MDKDKHNNTKSNSTKTKTKTKTKTHQNKPKSSKSSASFTKEELNRVELYLKAYATAARCSTRNKNENKISNSGTTSIDISTTTRCISPRVTFPKFNYLHDDRKSSSSSTDDYIELPATLSGKQRRQVHELCTLYHLYHSSRDVEVAVVDNNNNNANNNSDDNNTNNESKSNITITKGRVCVIARDRTVLEHIILNEQNIDNGGNHDEHYLRLLKECRPWYYRRHTSSTIIEHSSSSSSNSSSSTRSDFVWREDTHVRLVTSKMRCDVQGLAQNPSLLLHFHRSVPLEEDNCTSTTTTTKIDDDVDMSLSMNRFLPENHKDLTTVASIDSTPMVFIDTPQLLWQCQIELQNLFYPETSYVDNHPRILAFDLEMHNASPFTCKTCLIQMATLYKDYVVDVLAPGVWDHVGASLGPIFADRDIVKVGHAIGGMDVPSLHRDFGILVLNAFDTHEAARILKLPKCGLAAVCTHYGLTDCTNDEYVGLKEKYQKAYEDWIKRPLLSDMLRYARYDVRYLIYLHSFLIRDINADYWVHSKTGSNDALSRVISKSQRCCLQLWKHKEEKNILVAKNTGSRSRRRKQSQQNMLQIVQRDDWTKQNTRILRQLLSWRQAVAWNEEIIPQSICSMQFLTSVALICPASDDDFYKINSKIPTLLKEQRYKDEMLDIVRSRSLKTSNFKMSSKKFWRTSAVFVAYIASSFLISFANK